jgi:hypothetical protein
MRKEKKKKRKMRERREGRNEGRRGEVQTGRRKRKRRGWNRWPAVGVAWVQTGVGVMWVQIEVETGEVQTGVGAAWVQTHGRLGSSRPPRPMVRRLYFLIFSDGFCSGGFDFFIFSDDLPWILFFGFFFHMAPATFRVIKSQKWLTFPSRF